MRLERGIEPGDRADTDKSGGALTAALVAAAIVPQVGVGLGAPSLPAMASDFGVPIAAAQGTVIVYMAGYAISMLAAGMLSDLYGPRRTQTCGLLLAGMAAVLAGFAGSLGAFSALRFVQALGGCVGTVTARLIVAGHYAPGLRMRLLTMLASAFAITPCVAPLLGGALLPSVGWRGISMINGALCLSAMVYFHFASGGLRRVAADPVSLRRIPSIYLRTLREPRFAFYAASISSVWMSYFAFVSCSPRPLAVDMGLSNIGYGAAISLPTLGYVAGSTAARRLALRRDVDAVIRLASVVGCAGGAALIACCTIFPHRLAAVAFPVTVILSATGLAIPASQAGFLAHAKRDAGVASGLFFFLEMMAGAVYAGAGNKLQDGSVAAFGILVALPVLLLPLLVHAMRRRLGSDHGATESIDRMDPAPEPRGGSSLA